MSDARTPVRPADGLPGQRAKTTLLNAWLRSPKLGDGPPSSSTSSATSGIDSDLIAASDDRTVELTTGCLCCTVSGDLVETPCAISSRAVCAVKSIISTASSIETTGSGRFPSRCSRR